MSYILTGERRGRARRGCLRLRRLGGATSVEFDWSRVLRREERQGDVIGFYHTHPGGSAVPSRRDVKTMRAWVSCLGKPLLCVIEGNSKLAAYRFDTDESEGERLEGVKRLPRNLIVVAEDSR